MITVYPPSKSTLTVIMMEPFNLIPKPVNVLYNDMGDPVSVMKITFGN